MEWTIDVGIGIGIGMTTNVIIMGRNDSFHYLVYFIPYILISFHPTKQSLKLKVSHEHQIFCISQYINKPNIL